MPTSIPHLLGASSGAMSHSEMLDLLESVLSETQIRDLSDKLAARRISKVSAGDVITAQLMNQVLADVANLKSRITVLEQGDSSSKRPQIVRVQPSDGVRLSESLHVQGSNLSPNTLTSVFFGSGAVNTFHSGSDDRNLVFIVPRISEVREGLREAKLEIENQYGSDSIMVKVKPFEMSELDASFGISVPQTTYSDVEKGSFHELTFTIRGRTNMTEKFFIRVHGGGRGWDHRFDDGTKEKLITIEKTDDFREEYTTTVTVGDGQMEEVYMSIWSDNSQSGATTSERVIFITK